VNSQLVVLGAGLLGGAMNALAGGGSFITLPALISVGVPSVLANSSNTVGLYPGTAASAWAYREGLTPVGGVPLRVMTLVTLIGGAAGAFLLLRTSTRLFDFLLPWLLLVATLMLTFGRRLGEALRRRWHIRPGVLLLLQFALGIYGGYFGGAVGIMMVAVWGLIDGRDLKSMNAPRTLANTAANTAAVVIFIMARAVRWRETLLLLIGATVGGYGGAQLGRRAPAWAIRAGTLAIAFGMTVVFFVRAYFEGAAR